jgi:hypothetical protein
MLARAAMASVLPPDKPFSANSSKAMSRISCRVRSRSRRLIGTGFAARTGCFFTPGIWPFGPSRRPVAASPSLHSAIDGT